MNNPKYVTQQDEVLIGKNLQNENDIADLLHQHRKQFYSYIMTLVKDHYAAEDIFQECCIKIIHCIRSGKYKEEGRFMAWTSRIIRNMCMDYLNAKNKKFAIKVADGADIFELVKMSDDGADKNLVQQQFEKRIHQMLDKVSVDQREVIILRFFYQLSFKEIANITNTNVNTALGRMRYGLDKLRELNMQLTEVL